MIENFSLARPYAKAIFNLAQKEQRLEAWHKHMQILGLIAKELQNQRLLDSPQVTSEQLVQLFKDCYGRGYDQDAEQLIQALAKHRRLAILEQISILYHQLLNEKNHTLDVYVTTIIPLAKAQEEKLSEVLRNHHDQKIVIHSCIDPNLIGGITVTIGNNIIDGSIKGKLQKLKQHLMA